MTFTPVARLLCLVCLLLCAIFPALAEEPDELVFEDPEEIDILVNGSFDDVRGGIPYGWTKEMWYTDSGVSRLYIEPDGYDGACIAIENIEPNDARFAQTVSVEPDSIYRVSAMVYAADCDFDGIGATLSIGDLFCYSESVYDTGGEWEPLVFYGRTGTDQTSLTLFARVGGYGYESCGFAMFDDIEMVRVEQAPIDVLIHSFDQSEEQDWLTAGDFADTEEDDIPERNTEMWLLCICLYGLAVMAVLKRHRAGSPEADAPLLLAAGLGAAMIVRLIVSVRVRGYNTDISCFTAWSERIFTEGPLHFYAEDYFCDYPPLYMLLLWPVAALRRLLNMSSGSAAYYLLLKCLPMACDIAGAYLVWHTGRKHTDERTALLAALLYAFNPAAALNSAAWGQIDAVLTLLIVLCALNAVDRRYTRALVWFALAMLVKPQALLFAPVGLAAIVFGIVSAEKDARKALILRALCGLGAALGILYLTAFLFTVCRSELGGSVLTRPVRWLFDLYGGTMSGYRYITVNTLNLYCLLGLNWASADAHPVVCACAWILFALSYTYSALLCLFSRKKPARLLTVGAVLIVLICTFGPMIHERYIFPALLLLALSCVFEQDRRLWIALTVLTVTTFLNEVLVLQGGMTTANYGHLQASETWLNSIVCIVNIANALLLIWTGADICLRDQIWKVDFPAPEREAEAPVSDHKLHIRRVDALLMAGVTILYSCVAFINLGSTKAPQTAWTSAYAGTSVTFDLGDTETFRMTYYGGICNTAFTVQLSDDGSAWSEAVFAQYDQGTIFRWLWFTPRDDQNALMRSAVASGDEGAPAITYSEEETYPFQTARYVRLTAESAGLILYEVAFLDEEGEPLPIVRVSSDDADMETRNSPALLVDEQDTVAAVPGYCNGTYFDEIYHARTAYEQLNRMNVYEWTHPPLGKALMMLGIKIFGMTPFGWRFMGALIGVLMLPLMYLLILQLTKDTRLAAVGMVLLALDSMHFTQTRIATIDSYAVFWIMLMYLFMFRYIQMDWRRVSLRRSLIPLGLCGVTMGIAWATKWIGMYASLGLAALFFAALFRQKQLGGSRKRILLTLGFCCVFFVLIPLVIYYFSYYWHLCGEGMTRFSEMFSMEKLKRVIDIQINMFRYHSGLGGDTHFFRSPWYQWPVIYWPMWYFSGADYIRSDLVSSISCMGNPAVWWFGLAALIHLLIKCCRSRKAERADAITLTGFASQFMPWVLVPRSTFIYHYFASVPFIILCSVLTLRDLERRNAKAARIAAAVLTALALILFIAFYPLESGAICTRSYARFLRWFNWYNY